MKNINYTAPMPASPSAALMGYARRLAGDRIGDTNINAWQDHSVISGGRSNCIEGVLNNGLNTANFSFIGGGQNNIVRSTDSSIVGGNGNTIPVNMPNTHIIGSGIVVGGLVGNANSLHVNGLWANGIPGPFLVPPGLNVGTVWFGPPGIVGANALYIV